MYIWVSLGIILVVTLISAAYDSLKEARKPNSTAKTIWKEIYEDLIFVPLALGVVLGIIWFVLMALSFEERYGRVEVVYSTTYELAEGANFTQPGESSIAFTTKEENDKIESRYVNYDRLTIVNPNASEISVVTEDLYHDWLAWWPLGTEVTVIIK